MNLKTVLNASIAKRALRFFRGSPNNNNNNLNAVNFPEEPLGLSVAEQGGYHAAALGSTLKESRYTVVSKLGWGIHSSVWLARDSKQCHPHPRYVAVKILSTHATEVQGKLASELDVLTHIAAHANARPGPKPHVATLLDSFTFTDQHGPHLCLVFEPLAAFHGPIFDAGRRLPVRLVRDVAKQLLTALDFLHRECRIIHTDLKPSNILVTLPNFDGTIRRYLNELNSPSAAAVSQPAETPESEPSLPIALSRPLPSITLDDIQAANGTLPPNCEIQLADFGTAATVDGFHADLIQPYALRAPEVILGNTWDTSADIWNLGCLLFEFLTGSWLFSPQSGPGYTAEKYHLAHMPVITGDEFDIPYVREGKNYDTYFTPDGTLRLRVQIRQNLEGALNTYRVLDDAEMPLCVDFLRSMLRLKPSDRATASDLLEHAWIKS